MKKHINLEQIQKVNIERLISYYPPTYIEKEYLAELTDITKLIEILEKETDFRIELKSLKEDEKKNHCVWIIDLREKHQKMFKGLELCDVLWKAVMYVFDFKEKEEEKCKIHIPSNEEYVGELLKKLNLYGKEEE